MTEFQFLPFCLSLSILALGYFAASWVVTSRFLHYFQQEEYDNIRFLQWWIRSGSFERRAALLTLIFALALYLSESSAGISTLPVGRVILLSLVIAASIAGAGFSNRSSAAKKALVMTQRAKRIYAIALAAQIVLLWSVPGLLTYISIGRYYLFLTSLTMAALFAGIPLTLVFANLLLAPFESIVQKRYLNEAKDALARIKPEIIGITGSYGKTSIKHILAHILASHAPTLATPGSVNTLMGITRIVREKLRNDCAYFIVEMGAYGIGSIQRLCGLTPPNYAIVTSIGLAHRERFKTIDAVRQAKSELPRALPVDGIAIFNGDDPQLRKMAEELNADVRFYGTDASLGKLDCRLLQVENTQNGVRGTVEYEGRTYTFETPIFGKHQALNAAGAFLAAVIFGVAPFTAIAALQNMPQIPHRLTARRDANGIVSIDDAYNSNPAGFESALEVLKTLEGKRKILITPGMVELGDMTDEAHRQIAAHAAHSCDEIALTAASRLQSFRDGLLENGFPKERLHEFDSLREAQSWLNSILQSGDVLLYENDLPDLYEKPTAFQLF
jgi:UDP-N-acetylmuramoyl-tripeptide--D-alanyl-D-alanine ligase